MLEAPNATLKKRRSGSERKAEVLRAVATMLEEPNLEKVTTARVAASLDISEGLLYRYFDSKSAIFDALIDFVEDSLIGLTSQIRATETLTGVAQVEAMVAVMLKFAETNRGLARIMTGQVLIYETPKLTERMNRVHGALENALKQGFRTAIAQHELPADFDASGRSKLLMAFVLGQWQRFVLSAFQVKPGLKGPHELSIFVRP